MEGHAAYCAIHAGDEMSDAEETISRLWQQARPRVARRLDLLEAVARGDPGGRPVQELREDAITAAHQLAGSLGSYGIANGSELARSIEQELDNDADPVRLRPLVEDLRRVTGLPSGSGASSSSL